MTHAVFAARNETGRLERVWSFIYWWMKTLMIVWLAPYILLAFVAAVVAVLGFSATELRENIVASATLDESAWASLGTTWRWYAAPLGGVVLLWRVIHATPTEQLMDRVGARVTAWLGRVTRPVTSRLDTFNGRLSPWQRAGMTIAMAIALVAVLLGLLQMAPRPPRPTAADPSLTRPMQPPAHVSSAALTLVNGELRTGAADVLPQGKDVFVVTFKPLVDADGRHDRDARRAHP